MKRVRQLFFTVAAAGLVGSVAFSTTSAQATATDFVKEFGTMWTFDAPPLDYWEATYGFRPDQAWLDHVRLSSVRLPGCSSSFVSPNGLVMTNHHCSRRCITATSTADSNYMETGFVAGSMADEKPCPGVWVDQLQSIEDVTARIRQAVTATDDAGQVEQRNAAIQQIQQECRDETGLNCQVVTFYQGGMYSLYRYKRFSDVRLVMAPEGQAAFFGGDPDNFTYPRYDLDLTLLRVYEDGQPRATDHYLEWSENGAEEGELVLITGNPGSTGRLLTVAQMEYLRDVQYPAQLARYARQLEIVRHLQQISQSEDERQQYQNQIFGIENSQKAVGGYLTGLLDPVRMGKKQAFEQDFRGRIDADPELRAKYGSAWDAIAEAQQELASFAVQRRWYGFGGSTLLGFAGAIVQGDLSDRDRRQILADRSFNLEAEILGLTAQLEAAQAELPHDDAFLRLVLGGREPAAVAEGLVNGTQLTDASVRQSLVEGGESAVAASDDPMIVLARQIQPYAAELQERAEPLADAISVNAELIGQAIFSAYGKSLPPDATFTLRITDGVVKRYPMNGTYAPYKTTLYGLYARAAEFNNEPPWNMAPRWVEREDQLDLTTPINFVSTNDIIGGNSGSPVINRNAEVVGLVFDGNIQFLPNRFVFSDEVGRTVSVHSEGILEGLRKIYDAHWIADELEGVGR
jgi:hypothetical protein